MNAIQYAAHMVVATERGAAQIEQQMAATPVLARVPATAVKQLVGQGTMRQYRRGTYLWYQDDHSEHVLFLCQGRIAVSSISVTGHRQLLTTLDRPQFFGELGVLGRSEEHTSELQSRENLVCRLLLEK